jgi:hypothetical protein
MNSISNNFTQSISYNDVILSGQISTGLSSSSSSLNLNQQQIDKYEAEFLKTGKPVKIDIPKPWLFLNDGKLVDSNKGLIVDFQDVNSLKPIYIDSESQIYYPYDTGKIAIINTKEKSVKFEYLGFEIADFSIFQGKYWITESVKDCPKSNMGYSNCNKKIYEINKSNFQDKKIVFDKVGLGRYYGIEPNLEFVDENFLYLQELWGDSCSAYISFTKLDRKTMKFIDKYQIDYSCGNYIVTQILKPVWEIGNDDYEANKKWQKELYNSKNIVNRDGYCYQYNEISDSMPAAKKSECKSMLIFAEKLFYEKFPEYLNSTTLDTALKENFEKEILFED